MKTFAQKNQTQLWNHLYKSNLFACGSVGFSHPAHDEIKQRFAELQQYLEQVIDQAEKEAAE
jgi:hypothetical protein